MRIAIIHEWLVTYSGSERVLEQILAVYPDADLFCVIDFLDNQNREFILGKKMSVMNNYFKQNRVTHTFPDCQWPIGDPQEKDFHFYFPDHRIFCKQDFSS